MASTVFELTIFPRNSRWEEELRSATTLEGNGSYEQGIRANARGLVVTEPCRPSCHRLVRVYLGGEAAMIGAGNCPEEHHLGVSSPLTSIDLHLREVRRDLYL